jgi:ribosomal protein L11 methyltransferase
MLRRVSVDVPAERVEEARARMLELFPHGFEEVDRVDGIELVAYTDSRGEERLWEVFGAASASDVAQGWENRWRRFHRPTRVGRLWIGPPWETPDTGAIAVVVDPGRAFGTGSHPTTRLCLELLQDVTPGSLVDAGCGSGVLAVAGCLLGFSPVTALDVEDAAVEATRANAAANGATPDARRLDVLADALPEADLTVANILLDTVERLAPRVRSPLYVASGYLASDRPSVPGWRRKARRELDGWAADLFERDAVNS